MALPLRLKLVRMFAVRKEVSGHNICLMFLVSVQEFTGHSTPFVILQDVQLYPRALLV